MRDIGTLFLDKVQDLTPVALAVLRALTRGRHARPQDELPQHHPGAQPGGELPEALRRQRAGRGRQAFREGPIPELYMAKEEGVLRRLLREKVGIFLEELVVLLYLPYLHRRKQYDEERTEKLLRNLVDVGITRAMHNVNVFTLGSEDPIMNDLAASFKD